jgi:hypothetical protein
MRPNKVVPPTPATYNELCSGSSINGQSDANLKLDFHCKFVRQCCPRGYPVDAEASASNGLSVVKA